MLTVTQLAKKHKVSRTTILYYERTGLLEPACRSDNGYRWYGDNESKKLEAIMSYRSYGMAITDIASLLDSQSHDSKEDVLQTQFNALEEEIQKLRQQQKAILALLEKPDLLKDKNMDKDRWVGIMRASGLDDDDMKSWHKQFELKEPKGHQKFLESLNIDQDEIEQIRNWSLS
mgnify:CR=1 FL=1